MVIESGSCTWGIINAFIPLVYYIILHRKIPVKMMN